MDYLRAKIMRQHKVTHTRESGRQTTNMGLALKNPSRNIA